MKELNRHTLRDALDRLPAHRPPERLWADIEAGLDAQAPLDEALRALPTYAPPPGLWEQIEPRIERGAGGGRLLKLYRLAAAAAVALLLSAAGWWWQRERAGAGYASIRVEETVADDQLLLTLQETDDSAFEQVETWCRIHQTACREPHFAELKAELDELTEARTHLRNALGRYGDDPELVHQLVEIERDRSDILKQLVEMI